jgi:hypothetical protein
LLRFARNDELGDLLGREDRPIRPATAFSRGRNKDGDL